MRVFGTKQLEPTDEDRAAAARLSAVSARFKSETASDFTEVAPDPIGEPDTGSIEPEESRERDEEQ